MKKSFKLTKIEKEKSYCLISHLLACFIEHARRPCFCFAEGLTGLIDGVAIGGVELRRKEVAVGFFIIFVKHQNHFPKVYGYKRWFLGIFFLWVAFSENQIVKA